MSAASPPTLRFAQSPLFGLGLYFATLAGLMLVAGLALSSLADDYADLAAADMREDIGGHGLPGSGAQHKADASDSPFLEGPTLTVAGAALQERVGAAVKRVGGNVLSSQIDLQGPQASQGFVSLMADCEVSPTEIQNLLYDIEAGMPFLFIDQLEIHTSDAGEKTERKMRVQLGVSAQWRREK